MKKVIIGLIFITGLFSCTDNDRVKSFGGSASIELPPNTKLVNVTWKENNLWVLTKNMTLNDSAESYIFREKSSYGLLEGKYIIKEVRKYE